MLYTWWVHLYISEYDDIHTRAIKPSEYKTSIVLRLISHFNTTAEWILLYVITCEHGRTSNLWNSIDIISIQYLHAIKSFQFCVLSVICCPTPKVVFVLMAYSLNVQFCKSHIGKFYKYCKWIDSEHKSECFDQYIRKGKSKSKLHLTPFGDTL